MNALLSSFEFWIYKTPSFEGMKIKQLDDASVSMLVVRFACPINATEPGPFAVKVQKKNFREILRQISSTAVLKISQRQDRLEFISDDVHRRKKGFYKLSTMVLDDHGIPEEASDIQYQHSLELDIETCSKFFKLAQTNDLPTTSIQFRILAHKQRKQTVFHMSYRSAANDQGDEFFSDQDDLPIDEDDCFMEELFTEQYSSTFHIEYLRKFMRSLERDEHVTVNLARDQPICLSLSLGIEKSHVRYYIAPLLEVE